MKRLMKIFALVGIALIPLTCFGPDCEEEIRQEGECQNLIFVAYLACSNSAGAEADATARLSAYTACGNNMLAGILVCSTQIQPGCDYY